MSWISTRAASEVTSTGIHNSTERIGQRHTSVVEAEVEADSRADISAAGAGTLAALALVCFLFATRSEFIAVTGILSSLYRFVPVALGLLILREHLYRASTFGLVAALVAGALIAMTPQEFGSYDLGLRWQMRVQAR